MGRAFIGLFGDTTIVLFHYLKDGGNKTSVVTLSNLIISVNHNQNRIDNGSEAPRFGNKSVTLFQ
jgi:hypothetical protein